MNSPITPLSFIDGKSGKTFEGAIRNVSALLSNQLATETKGESEIK